MDIQTQMVIMIITWSFPRKRSLAVAQYLTEIQGNFLSPDEISDLQNYLTVNGHGSANPVLDSKGNEDKNASRRVEVKIPSER